MGLPDLYASILGEPGRCSEAIVLSDVTEMIGAGSSPWWLVRIVVNEASGRLRRQRRRADIIQLVPGGDGGDGGEEDSMDEAFGAAPEAPDEAGALRPHRRQRAGPAVTKRRPGTLAMY